MTTTAAQLVNHQEVRNCAYEALSIAERIDDIKTACERLHDILLPMLTTASTDEHARIARLIRAINSVHRGLGSTVLLHTTAHETTLFGLRQCPTGTVVPERGTYQARPSLAM